ncbi:kinesin 2 [Mycena floridula]|nr:kinesin 2 [Mycena floridula]
MATKRPPSSRSKATSNSSTMPPPQQQRSRSAMSKLGSSSHSTDDQPTKPLQKSGPEPSTETNIQVVIRCRRRSEREIQDNSPIIANSNGAKSNQISIETSAPSSTLGIVTLAPIRTYPFDLVFGPEADQAMVYHDVVGPMLDQVVMGYNCTLFAYGQTGTGKTYTMQGDLAPTPLGNPSAHAGMIPRVLFRLFHHLETSETDYSVKISYIELYNEELRDLLSNDLAAPTGNTQPMGKDKNVDNGLKIFDDANKRGVFIQGVEEVSVKNSKDALALLTKGSERRQIAATKFNDHSSRSHSIFSITVHIKETSAMGDDLLKIGKLNLVDLAGSENIGRSGAENKRAREAGMINQSLLTLGRVITALVEKAQHVPYRESKLTRLLQDSLGGRTKTCIIATVSPARCNLEETLSTLNYALQAKSIRNKPELNQRMTRNSLLKEYVAEIERLKADLLAAREKNGICLSEDTWNQLNAEQELRETEIQEARKHVEIVENQMRAVRQEFEESIGLLMKSEAELKETKETLAETQEELQEREKQLVTVKGELEDEIIVRQAFEENEGILDTVASGLKGAAALGVQDIGGLFDKLDRKSSVLSANSQAVLKHGKALSSSTHTLLHSLDEFSKASSQNITRMQREVKQFEDKELSSLSSLGKRVDDQLQRLQATLESIQTQGNVETEALKSVQAVIHEAHDVFKTELGPWADVLKATCRGMIAESQSTATAAFENAEKSMTGMATQLEAVIREAHQFVDSDQQSLLHLQILINDATNAELKRVRQQSESLSRMLEQERSKNDKGKDELIQQVSGLLSKFAQDRDKGLRTVFGAVQGSNSKAEDDLQTLQQTLGEKVERMGSQSTSMKAGLDKKSGEGKRMRDGSIKALMGAKSSVDTGLTNLNGSIPSSIDSYSTRVHQQMRDVYESSSDAFDRHSKAKKARVEATDAMATELQSDFKSFQRGAASTFRSIESFAGSFASESASMSGANEGYRRNTATHLTSIQQSTKLMVEQGAREDTATGSTPRKRVWDYVDQWELTENRATLLKTRRTKSTLSPLHQDEDVVVDEEEVPEMATEHIPSSPDTASLLSSTSSLASLPPHIALRAPVGKRSQIPAKSGIPVTGTLTDSRNVNVSRTTRRR